MSFVLQFLKIGISPFLKLRPNSVLQLRNV